MKIANPLYDHAFKYLMSNDRLARKVLSVILEKEVLQLELAQQEVVIEDEERRFTLYRLDFKALIRDENGRQETVLIELQKSKLPTNALRFRSYLGLSYAQKTKSHASAVGEREAPLPIISIYILGYNVEDIPVMATKVNRRIIDMSSQEELHIESDFINLLTHTCYILQVRRLPAQRLSRIERFMTLFNQAWVAEENFILDLEEVPEEFKDIAEYLQRPLAEEELQRKLRAEEEIEELFALQEAEKAQLRSMAEAARKDKEAAQIRVEEERRQKEQAQIREEAERRQKEQALEKARESALKLARLLLKTGFSVEEAARETGLTEAEIRGLG
ncbi:MAG: cell envelope integrity protein TolA [Saprospiraceae bacterium]